MWTFAFLLCFHILLNGLVLHHHHQQKQQKRVLKKPAKDFFKLTWWQVWIDQFFHCLWIYHWNNSLLLLFFYQQKMKNVPFSIWPYSTNTCHILTDQNGTKTTWTFVYWENRKKVLIHLMESLMNEFEWGWIIEPTKLI